MRPVCGSCPACRRATTRLIRPPRRQVSALPGAPPVTAAALEKHARRFGSAQVVETAAECGVSVMVKRDKGGLTPEQRRARRRRMTRR